MDLATFAKQMHSLFKAAPRRWRLSCKSDWSAIDHGREAEPELERDNYCKITA